MFRVRTRRSSTERQVEAQGRALVGMVDAAMIMACADGELADEEFEVVGQVIDGFFDGNVTRDEVVEMMELSLEAIEREGLDGRMEAVAQNLESAELRELGLAAAATVMLSDAEIVEGEEDEVYFQLADALEIPRRRAEAIADEVAAQFE